MDLNQYIPEIIIAFFGGFTGWFFTRRSKAANAESIEIDNIEKAIEIWRNTAQGLEEQFQSQIEGLRKEIDGLRKEVKALKEENMKLKSLHKKLRDEQNS